MPFPAGGTTDTLGRLIGQKLGPALSTIILMDNKGGAGGSIGSEIASRATPDGLHLAGRHHQPARHQCQPVPKLAYDPIKSFALIVLIGSNPVMLVVAQNSPFKTLQDVIAIAKAKAKTITSASAGSGTFQHLSVELLGFKSRTQLIHVPYKGSSPAIADVMGGQVEMMFETTVVTAEHFLSSKLRALAVTSSKRLEGFPNVPTVAESGASGLANFEVV